MNRLFSRGIAWTRTALPLLHAAALLVFLAARHVVEAPAGPPSGALTGRVWAAGRDVVSLATEFVPFWFAPLPAWLLTALLARSRAALLSATAPWLVFVVVYGGLFVPRLPHLRQVAPAAAPGQPAVDLRVMTFNLLYVNGAPEELAAAVRRAAPDVLLVQELSPTLATSLDAALRDEYPYRDLRPHPGPEGGGVWSRRPLRVEETWGGVGGVDGVGSAGGASTATGPTRNSLRWQHLSLEHGGRRVHLVNLHLTPPEVYFGTVRRLPVPVYVGQSTAQRRREVDAFVPAVRALAREPLVVAGDLNLTDQTPEYRLLRSTGLRDAYREAGWGFGLTFPAHPKLHLRGLGLPIPSLIRIDYVLHSRHFTTRSAAVLQEVTGSDHRPVVATLRLRPG